MAWMWENVKKEQERCWGWVAVLLGLLGTAGPEAGGPSRPHPSGPLALPHHRGPWAKQTGFDYGSVAFTLPLL